MKVDWSKVPKGTPVGFNGEMFLFLGIYENDAYLSDVHGRLHCYLIEKSEACLLRNSDIERYSVKETITLPPVGMTIKEFQKKCITVTQLDDDQFQKALARYRDLIKIVAVSDCRHALVVAINSVGGVVQEGIN
jgi:hypothetical protein